MYGKVLMRIVPVLAIFLALSACTASEHDKSAVMRLGADSKTKSKLKKVKRAKNKAQDERYVVVHKSLPKKSKHRYFVEFRARPNGVASHSYIAYGRLSRRGRISRVRLVGLHPKERMPDLLIAGLVGKEAQIKPVWGDKNIRPVVTFRVPIEYKQYKKIVNFVKQEKKKKHVWNLLLNNCNGFVGRVAELVGLEAPGGSAVAPTFYVKQLISLNT